MTQTWPDLAELASVLFRIVDNSLLLLSRLWFQTHIRTNGIAAIEPVDFVTAKATVLPNQIVALVSFGSGRPELRVLTKFCHVVVTLDTR